MKKDFIGYYQLNKDERETLWKNAIIVFDTNVLLDLYRYRKSTRDDLLKVMEKFKDRLFVPHHVMLEFHKNRLSVIAGQYNKFDRVKSLVEDNINDLLGVLKKEKLDERHSDIELDTFTEQLSKSAKKLYEDLDKSKKKSLSINTEDKILSSLEKLFSKKIGKPYDQEEIVEIYKEGEVRYNSKVPPGYKDADKSGDFKYNDILIKRKFGDLLIWKQILDYSIKQKNTDLIFVTSDVKEDWFWEVKGQTIKCRPELTEEISKTTKVERFKIYKTERFLEYASEFLGSKLNDDVLSDVKSVTSRAIVREQGYSRNEYRTSGRLRLYEKAVANWLESQGGVLTKDGSRYPDFITYRSNSLIGYEVKSLLRGYLPLYRVVHEIDRAANYLEECNSNNRGKSLSLLERMSIVFVVSKQNDRFADFIMEVQTLALPDGVSLIFGFLNENNEFEPSHVITNNK